MGAEDSEREQLVKAHAWIRLFADGRTLNNYNEEGVWFDRLPQKRVDGSIFITTGIQPWADVEADLKAHGVAAPDLTRGELAAKRALGLVVAMLVLMAGCATQEERLLKAALKSQVQMVQFAAEAEHASPPIRIAEDGCVICCPDMRWGKCEEHGEWLDLYGFQMRYIGNKPATATTVAMSEYGPTRMYLVCPRGHYIEKEIRGPDEQK